MSQVGAGEKVKSALRRNVPNSSSDKFLTAEMFSNGYKSILSGRDPLTDQNRNSSRQDSPKRQDSSSKQPQKRSKRQTNILLNIPVSNSLETSIGPTTLRSGGTGLLSGLPLHSQTSQASPSTSVRANQKAAAVNQRTTNSSLLLERVAVADDQFDEDLFQIGKNFVTGLGPQTKILDVPFDKIGTLCGVAPTISFIPDNKAMLKQILQIFIHYMRQIQNFHSTRRREDECLAWKKYFLLPTILFDNNRQGKVKDVIRERIKVLASDDWSALTLGSLQLKPPQQNLEISENDVQKRITKLLRVGQISKAYRVLTGDRTRLPQDSWAYEMLKSKFPEQCKIHLSTEQHDALKKFKPPPIEDIEMYYLEQLILGQGNQIAHGFDHLRHEHLKKLIGWGNSTAGSLEYEFRSLYKYIILRLMNGSIPLEVRPLYTDTEAFAAPKSATDIRPLGKINLDRKIAAALLLKLNRKEILHAFAGIQYGCDPKGTEKIIHSARLGMEKHPEYDLFAPDATNAFNLCNRSIGLHELKERVPSLFAFTKFLYGSHSKTWFHGMEDGIQGIQCKEGSQQGCNLGNLLCGMSFQPFVEALSEIVKQNHDEAAFAKFFVDDGNIFSSPVLMRTALKYIVDCGPTFGYHMNLSKSVYLIGRCTSYDEAISRKTHLVDEFGFRPENVHIHPDNYFEQDIDQNSLKDIRSKFGVKILGSYVGSEEFIRSSLQSKLEDLQKEAEKLISYSDLQQKYIFLRYCFDQKITHILRTTDFWLTNDFAEKFDNMKKAIFCSIIGQFDSNTLPDVIWTQVCLSTSRAGFGITDSKRARCAASVASAFDCMETLNQIVPNWLQDNPDPDSDTLPFAENVATAVRSIDELSSFAGNQVNLSFTQIQEMMGRSKEESEIPTKIGRQHDLYTLMNKAALHNLKEFILSKSLKHHAWILSLELNMSATFLNVIPKCPSMTFDNSQFRILVNLRLFLDQPDLLPGIRCDCARNPTVDNRCHHMLTSCSKMAFGLRVHNSVLNTLKECLQSGGLMVTREPMHMFQGVFDADSQFTEKEKNMRPDLYIHGKRDSAYEVYKNIVIDASWIHPFPIYGNAPYTEEKSLTRELHGKRRLQEKRDKYEAIATANNLKFYPIIFENTGGIISESYEYLQELLKVFSGGYKEGALLRQYWKNRISCAYFHSVATEIQTKIKYLTGARYVDQRYENRASFIQESSSISYPN